MTRHTRCKHTCDECGNQTLINSGSRLTWYHYKNESLCAACFEELSDEKKKDVDDLNTLLYKIYGFGFAKSMGCEDEDATYQLTDDNIKLLKKFDAIKEKNGKERVMIHLGTGGWYY